jgi:hypothetical protein
MTAFLPVGVAVFRINDMLKKNEIVKSCQFPRIHVIFFFPASRFFQIFQKNFKSKFLNLKPFSRLKESSLLSVLRPRIRCFFTLRIRDDFISESRILPLKMAKKRKNKIWFEIWLQLRCIPAWKRYVYFPPSPPPPLFCRIQIRD